MKTERPCPETEKALIAMSGGVDSSVAAYLVRETGRACRGITLKLVDSSAAGLENGSACCSLQDVEDARRVAFRLGIPYAVYNFTADFRRQVLEPFAESYAGGRTPNPCVACNRNVKFAGLYRCAQELRCAVFATGHYARIGRCGDSLVVQKAADKSKDQSYMLYSLTQRQLQKTLFPLGDRLKSEVRELARGLGLATADKPDSQDLCFAPDGDYAGAVRRCTGRCFAPGPILDEAGRVLGTHRGLISYTVGQRRGLGLAAPEPLYVLRIDAPHNAVVVGGERALYGRELTAADFCWCGGVCPGAPVRVTAKIRYRAPEQPALALPQSDGTVHIVFDEPQRAITPGQAVVLYDGDTVAGGGIIQAPACETARSAVQ